MKKTKSMKISASFPVKLSPSLPLPSFEEALERHLKMKSQTISFSIRPESVRSHLASFFKH